MAARYTDDVLDATDVASFVAKIIPRVPKLSKSHETILSTTKLRPTQQSNIMNIIPRPMASRSPIVALLVLKAADKQSSSQTKLVFGMI